MRWVVEAVNGILGQKFRLLHDQLDNKLLPKIRSYVRIACFLNNQFKKRLNSDVENRDEILSRMESQHNLENSLANEVEKNIGTVKELSSIDLTDFPGLTEKDLKIFLTGSYQYKVIVKDC